MFTFQHSVNLPEPGAPCEMYMHAMRLMLYVSISICIRYLNLLFCLLFHLSTDLVQESSCKMEETRKKPAKRTEKRFWRPIQRTRTAI